MTRLFAIAVVFAAVLPAVASQPGQPLGDCSDWVILRPGITCTVIQPFPCSTQPCNLTSSAASSNDNEGGFLKVVAGASTPTSCSGFSTTLTRQELRRFDGTTESVVAYIDERCGVGATKDGFAANTKWLDAARGDLYVAGLSSCQGSPCSYSTGSSLSRFGGFPALFDVLLTFVPSASAIGFSVPLMPEGMGGADHFDTYWGPLPGPIDFTQTHPLQCDYPAAPPRVGDYLTINDPLPNPSSGHGYYYVTAATYQGQTRYGRKGNHGTLSGRDPGLLPACVQPVAQTPGAGACAFSHAVDIFALSVRAK